jgi:ankyrin repeat protein
MIAARGRSDEEEAVEMRDSLRVVVVLLWTIGLPVMAQAPKALTSAERALVKSAFTGELEAVQSLVSEGTSVDATDPEKRTPLMWAAFNGHTPVVRYLLEKGAKLEAKDVNGRTALMYASSGPYPETVEYLLKKGADVNVQGKLEGFTALMTAAAEGQVEVVRMLLAHGADPALKDVDGDTAETFAVQKGHSAVVDLLKNPSPQKD